jgi:alpha,alpha-trehalase
MIKKIINKEKIKSSLVTSAGYLLPAAKSPDEALGQLFADVQKQRVYEDGKTFVDLVPRRRVKAIAQEYAMLKNEYGFDINEFVARHFYDLTTKRPRAAFVADPDESIRQHVTRLWTDLERRNRVSKGSLIALPYAYVVPGGRFNEQFYWDSYFIMLGLAVDGRWDMIEGMIKNYAYMIRQFGFIPTANRTYFISRSQPPFFSHMIRLLASHKGKSVLIEYLPYLLKEYRFWMKGVSKLSKQQHRAYARVVETKDGARMNRYYDNKTTPRPESLHEDVTTAQDAKERDAQRLYLHLRSAAESGWDFSSRWFSDPNDIRTIHTADIIPVDLNVLLYQLEKTIADAYRAFKQPLGSRKFDQLAKRRARTINDISWDETAGFYMDYNFHHAHTTGRMTLAGVFPLYAGIASDQQAASVAAIIKSEFLKPGGLVTTLSDNAQQWDAPNGWAPLQYIAIQALRNYGYDDLAADIKQRWIATNQSVFASDHKLVEKYNVMGGSGLGGGGEYALQDGFGWTNGVLAALMSETDD